jgi:UDP-GlcNAc:undecaprenyl-phosphate GlcNAc-1-phosphate transferase
VAYLYAWTLLLASVAVALRLVPYSDHHGHYRTGWLIVIAVLGLIAVAASVYLIYVLEILKLKGLRAHQLKTLDPDTSEHEIEVRVQRELETGEFERLSG